MNFIRTRPLCFICAVFLFSSVLMYTLPAAGKLIFAIVAVTVAAVTLLLRLPAVRPAFVCGLLSAVLLATALSYVFFDLYAGGLAAKAGNEARFEATVTGVYFRTGYSSSYKLQVNSADGKRTSFGARLMTEYECDLDIGDRIAFTAVYEIAESSIGGYSTRRTELSDGILIRLRSGEDERCRVIGTSENNTTLWLRGLNFELQQRIYTFLDIREANFISAILLGNRDNADSEISRNFGALGMSHVLAISGLHLSILVGGLEILLRFLTVERRLRSVVLILFSLFIMSVTGFSPSVTRSALMLTVFYLSFVFYAPSDPLTALFISVTLIVAISPYSILDTGLGMSFFATLGIITLGTALMRPIRERLAGRGFWARMLFGIISLLLCSVSAIVFTFPYNLLIFGKISLVALPANLIFNLPVTIILAASAVLLAVSPFPPVAGVIARPLGAFSSVFLDFSGETARVAGVEVSLRYPFAAAAFVAALAVAGAVYLIRRRAGIAFLSFVLSGIAVFSLCLGIGYAVNSDRATIVYRSERGHDGFIIRRGNKVMICDISDGSYTLPNGSIRIAEQNLYVTDCDTLLLTHLHQRHISTLNSLNGKIFIRHLLIPSPQNETERGICDAISGFAEDNKIKLKVYQSESDSIADFHGVSVTVHSRKYIERSTHPLLRISIKAGEFDMDYFSASARAGNPTVPGCDVLIFGAHGPTIKQPPELSCPDGCEIICSDEETALKSGLPVSAAVGTGGRSFSVPITLPQAPGSQN